MPWKECHVQDERLRFVARRLDGESMTALWVLPMAGDRTASVFLKTPFAERWGTISPDGRWVAYHSNESGQHEIYLRPFVSPGASRPTAGTAGSQRQAST